LLPTKAGADNPHARHDEGKLIFINHGANYRNLKFDFLATRLVNWQGTTKIKFLPLPAPP